ncbi:MAG: hypothetical protein WDZ88_02840 [Candidatus Paceibacterota bacterium]
MRYTSIVFILSFAFLGTVSSMGIIHTVSLDAKLEKLHSDVIELQFEVGHATKQSESNGQSLAYDDGPVEISIISPADSKSVCRGDVVSITWMSTGLRDVGISVIKEGGKSRQVATVGVQSQTTNEYLWNAGEAIGDEELVDGNYSFAVSGVNGLGEFATDVSFEPLVLETCN